MFGRKTIHTSYDEVNEENIRSIVSHAMSIHEKNREEILKLSEYEKGKQDILNRVKDVRPEINEKIVENHASQIVNFKLSYVFGSPISYVQKAEKESFQNENDVINSVEKDDTCVTRINEMCFDENKHTKDQELAKTFLVCGVGYRGCFPSSEDDAFSPFRIVNLDPMTTFIVYGADVFHEPKLAVTYWRETDDKGSITNTHYTAYSKNKTFQFDSIELGKMKVTTNGIGEIPIVEYRNDYEKMGCFERVICLIDAINVCTSDRVNGLSQFIQSFMWFDNVDMTKDEFDALKEAGALLTESKDGKVAKIQLLESSLNQQEVQTLSDYLYSQLLQICNIPGRDSTSGSTTGQSSMLSGGWQEAEEDAHRSELMFMEGEKKFLKVMKSILDKSNSNVGGEIKLRDIDIKFSRNKIANFLVKTQGYNNLINGGVHPRIAMQTCDLFSDPNQVYLDSIPYLEKVIGSNDKNTDINDPQTVTEEQNEQISFINAG